MTQVKLPTTPAKLELARNYWDEMGRGNVKGMHGPMLDTLVETLAVEPQHRDHGVGEPVACECHDGDGDQSSLCLAFGGRAGRDRTDRTRPFGLCGGRDCGGSASATASGATSISTPCWM